jgi:cobalt-zinc-cadmium efflux system protein
MGHDHAHDHGVRADADTRPLAIALGLILAFMGAEVVAGVAADSLALLSDAAHMLVDAGALGLSVGAARLARRPPGGRMTFGFRRAEILSAQANAITLLALGVLILVEAVQRLVAPPSVSAPIVVVTAAAGAAVNLVAIWQVARANRESLNVEGSFRHLVTDFFAFAATVIAGVVVWTTGFDRADPVASLAVAGSMLLAAWPLLRKTGRVLLEAAPEGLRPEEIESAIRGHAGVVGLHDLHVWEISSGFPSLSAHVLVGRDEDCHRVRRELEASLHDRYGLEHTTLQVEHTGPRAAPATARAEATRPHRSWEWWGLFSFWNRKEEREGWRSSSSNTSGSTATSPSRTSAARRRSSSSRRPRRWRSSRCGASTAARPARPKARARTACCSR